MTQPISSDADHDAFCQQRLINPYPLFARLPDMRLATTEVEYQSAMGMRAIKSLPVRLR